MGGEPAVHRGAVRKPDRACSTKCICGSEQVTGSRETFASETVVAADTRVAPCHAVPRPAARREKESSAICEEGVRYYVNVKKECTPLIFCTPPTSTVWANDRIMPREVARNVSGGGKGWRLTRGRPEPLVDGSPPAAHSPACASRAAAQTFEYFHEMK